MAILDVIRSVLDPPAALARDQTGDFPSMEIWVGTVLLFLELAHGDTEYVTKERQTILRNIQREFGILRSDAHEIMELAERARSRGRDLREVSAGLRANYDADQRRRIIGLLWKVVNADGVVEDFEEVFVGHVTELMGLDAADAAEARRLAESGEL